MDSATREDLKRNELEEVIGAGIHYAEGHKRMLIWGVGGVVGASLIGLGVFFWISSRQSGANELLVNALVHRPYTQQGDIYLNLHPERLEVVNPGRLPLGVTPRNMLHASRRRNEGLARVFHDLGLMEREGSGFDLIYDRLLSQGRPAPVAEEGADWVKVTIQRRIVKPEVMRRAVPEPPLRRYGSSGDWAR